MSKIKIEEELTMFYEMVSNAITFPSTHFSPKERFVYFIQPEGVTLGTSICIIEKILCSFPRLMLDIERCERGHRIIVYPKKEGTKFNFSYANTRLDRIRNSKGNGILLMVVKDRLVCSIWESHADKFNDIILSYNALKAVMELETQEKCWKMSGLGTSKCHFYEKGTCLGKRLNADT